MRFVLPAVLLTTGACYPTTTRPSVAPLPEASVLEVELFVPDATRSLALALDADSIPVRRTEPADGWLESEWFDAATLQPTAERPVGPGIVKLRAWINPGRPNHSQITVETVYRPVADPSRDGRLLERQVADSHAVAKRIQGVMTKLRARYGEPIDTATQKSEQREARSDKR